MARFTPDPSFYASPADAAQAPPETHAYVVTLNTGTNGDRAPDALTVIDLEEGSPTYGQLAGRLEMPNVVDVKDDPRRPKLVKVIEAEEIARKAGYSRPHTIHCGPDGIYVSALGNPDGDGPGGIFLLDHDDFSVKGAWEEDRGTQELAYDFWWHLNYDTVLTSEWGTPNMVEDGLVGELLLGNRYGHRLHVWDLKRRRHLQEIDLGPENQMVLELRPSHDPTQAWGLVGVVVSTADLSASVWLWERGADGRVSVEKIITIPPEPAEAEQLPPILQPFGA